MFLLVHFAEFKEFIPAAVYVVLDFFYDVFVFGFEQVPKPSLGF